MWVRILGAAAGGGFPQWNCHCSNCKRLRLGTFPGRARSQAQAAVSADGRTWHLLNASPDLRGQIERAAFLWPAEGVRHTPIRSVILTGCEIDAVAGLLSLREFQPFTVYSTQGVQDVLLRENNLFHALQRLPEQVTWRVFSGGFAPEAGLPVEPIPLHHGYPAFVTATHAEEDAGVGLALGEGGRVLFLPAVGEITDELLLQMERCDLLLFDGTFWSDDELIRVQQGARTARQMHHLPISGAGGSLERLAGLSGPRKVYLHINNTNPVLDEESAEHRAVRDAGWDVGYDGMEFVL